MEVKRINNRLTVTFNQEELFLVSSIDCSNLDVIAPGTCFIHAGLIKRDKTQPTAFESLPFVALLTQTIRQYAQLHRTSPDVIFDQLGEYINSNTLTVKGNHEPETF